MGLYDTVKIGEREGQVKAWGKAMRDLAIGHEVGPINGVDTYDLAMREGGYIHVRRGRIVSWNDERMFTAVYDKWGKPWTGHNKGLLHERYHHLNTGTTGTITTVVTGLFALIDEQKEQNDAI